MIPGGVVRDDINDDSQAGLVRGFDEVLGIREGPETRINIAVVGYILAGI